MIYSLYDLKRKVEFQDQLTEQEQAYVETKAQSSILIEAIDANAILAISGTSDQRKAALDKLESLCSEQLESDAKASFAMMCGLAYVVDPLPSAGRLREFVFRMAKRGTIGCRGNSILVLERLAYAGDATAKSLIQECTTDPDQYVRLGAAGALRRLDKHGPPKA